MCSFKNMNFLFSVQYYYRGAVEEKVGVWVPWTRQVACLHRYIFSEVLLVWTSEDQATSLLTKSPCQPCPKEPTEFQVSCSGLCYPGICYRVFTVQCTCICISSFDLVMSCLFYEWDKCCCNFSCDSEHCLSFKITYVLKQQLHD